MDPNNPMALLAMGGNMGITPAGMMLSRGMSAGRGGFGGGGTSRLGANPFLFGGGEQESFSGPGAGLANFGATINRMGQNAQQQQVIQQFEQGHAERMNAGMPWNQSVMQGIQANPGLINIPGFIENLAKYQMLTAGGQPHVVPKGAAEVSSEGKVLYKNEEPPARMETKMINGEMYAQITQPNGNIDVKPLRAQTDKYLTVGDNVYDMTRPGHPIVLTGAHKSESSLGKLMDDMKNEPDPDRKAILQKAINAEVDNQVAGGKPKAWTTQNQRSVDAALNVLNLGATLSNSTVAQPGKAGTGPLSETGILGGVKAFAAEHLGFGSQNTKDLVSTLAQMKANVAGLNDNPRLKAALELSLDTLTSNLGSSEYNIQEVMPKFTLQARQALADHIAVLKADHSIIPDSINRQVQQLNADPDYMATITGIHNKINMGQPITSDEYNTVLDERGRNAVPHSEFVKATRYAIAAGIIPPDKALALQKRFPNDYGPTNPGQ